MAQVTVEQLAETVGASISRLLAQMKDAGLPHSSADEPVSEEDKQTLLAHLKKSHGERAADAPKKITLKRKSVSTLRAGGAGKRTVNVEVRKKRTYVKRENVDEAVVEPEANTSLESTNDASAAAEVATPEPVVELEPIEEPLPNINDPEVLRQRAAARRKAEEQARQLEIEAVTKARAEEEARQAQEKANQLPTKEQDKKPRRLHAAPTKEAGAPVRDELRRRPGKGRLERGGLAGARGKQRGHNLSINDLEAAEAGVSRRRGGRRKKLQEEPNQHAFEQPTEKIIYDVNIPENITVVDLA